MKSQRGITLTSVVIYVIVMAIVVGIIATITAFFYSNTTNMSDSATNLGEFNKFNAAFLSEIKKTGNEVYKIENENQRIIFTSGTVFTYQDGGIYQNHVKICTGVTNCKFSTRMQEEKQIVSVLIEIGQNAAFAKTIEYVMAYSPTFTVSDLEEDYSQTSTKNYVQNGLQLYYDAINNTGGAGHSTTATTWKDLSGNNKDATLNNFSNTATSGWNAKEIVLDGTDDYIMTSLTQSDLGNCFTINVVCRMQSYSAYRGLWGLHNGSATTEVRSGTLLQCDGTNFVAGMAGCAVSVPASNYLSKTISITCIVESQKGVKLYIGNQLIGEATTSFTFNPVGNMQIGRSHENADRYWLGGISKFMIYNRELTQGEITQNYEVDQVRYGI